MKTSLNLWERLGWAWQPFWVYERSVDSLCFWCYPSKDIIKTEYKPKKPKSNNSKRFHGGLHPKMFIRNQTDTKETNQKTKKHKENQKTQGKPKKHKENQRNQSENQKNIRKTKKDKQKTKKTQGKPKKTIRKPKNTRKNKKKTKKNILRPFLVSDYCLPGSL